MSEESTVIPEAAPSEPSDSQTKQDQTIKATEASAEEELAETWPEAEPEKPEEAEGEEDDDKGEDDRPKKPSRSERLRRQNERLKAENEALRSGSAAPAVQNQADIDAIIAQEVGDPPKEDDFNGDWFAYERAMTAYEADKRQVTRQVKNRVAESQKAEQTRVADLLDDYVERCEEVAKTLPDFKKVVTSPDFRTTELVKRLILDAGDKAPLVAYNLAQNPKLCARVNAMSPMEAAREIGRIEGRVSIPKNNATRATPPLSTVKGGASPQRGLGKSMSDYERWRNS